MRLAKLHVIGVVLRWSFVALGLILLPPVDVPAQGHPARDTTSYFTYLGGMGNDAAIGSHALPGGDVVAVLKTTTSGLPTTGGPHEPYKNELTGDSDAYIVRFTPEAGTLVWASYVGGDLGDQINAMDCDDEASTCTVAGTREMPDGSTKAFATRFRLDGDFLCEFVDTGQTSSYGNHYLDPPEDDDLDDAHSGTGYGQLLYPVLFGAVVTTDGRRDAAMWILAPRTCRPTRTWTSGLPEDDVFYVGILNGYQYSGAESTYLAIHGFGSVVSQTNTSTFEQPLQCVLTWSSIVSRDWESACSEQPAAESALPKGRYVGAGYHDMYGLAAAVFDSASGTSTLAYWNTSDWDHVLGPPDELIDLGPGRSSDIRITSTGMLSLLRSDADESEDGPTERLSARVSATGEESRERLVWAEPTLIAGPDAGITVLGRELGLFRESQTGSAYDGLAASDSALGPECPQSPPGVTTCGFYQDSYNGNRFVTACNVSPLPVRWEFLAYEDRLPSHGPSGGVRFRGVLDVVECTRLLSWSAESGYRLTLFSSNGDTLGTRVDGDFERPYATYVWRERMQKFQLSVPTTRRRQNSLVVANATDQPIRTWLGYDWPWEANADTVAPGLTARFDFEPGPGWEFLSVASEHGESGMSFAVPFRDAIAQAVIYPDRRNENGHNVALFDDYGKLLAGLGWPPVASEPLPRLDGSDGSRPQIYPNPSNQAATIQFTNEDICHGSVEIVDLLGRLVRAYSMGVMGPGEHRFVWDTNDDRGSPVPAGAYLIRAGCDSSSPPGRLVVVR